MILFVRADTTLCNAAFYRLLPDPIFCFTREHAYYRIIRNDYNLLSSFPSFLLIRRNRHWSVEIFRISMESEFQSLVRIREGKKLERIFGFSPI